MLDRLSEAAVLAGLLFHYTEIGGHTQQILLIYAAVVGSILVSYVRARAEADGLVLREGLFTRAERVLVLGIALIVSHGAVPVALWVLAVLANLTAAQRVFVVWQKLHAEGAECMTTAIVGATLIDGTGADPRAQRHRPHRRAGPHRPRPAPASRRRATPTSSTPPAAR